MKTESLRWLRADGDRVVSESHSGHSDHSVIDYQAEEGEWLSETTEEL